MTLNAFVELARQALGMRGTSNGALSDNPAVHHVRGLLLAILGIFEGGGTWFLAHLQVINGVMQFALLSCGLVTTFIGVRKVLRKS